MKNAPDDYENVRGPRPWEDNREYKEQLDTLKEKRANQKFRPKSVLKEDPELARNRKLQQ